VKRNEDAFEIFGETNASASGFAVPKPPQNVQTGPKGEPLRKPNRPSAADCWVPQNIAFMVHHYRIHNGLVYCGSGLEAVAERGNPEPSLVNEMLPIGTDDEYYSRKLDHLPNYASATPDARAAYLNWLANGRRDKKSNIGYVYLYFYGLERRAFIDVHADPAARADIPAIIEEVEALSDAFGKSKAFVSRARSFVNTLRAVAEGSRQYLEPPPDIEMDEGPSYLHSVALAQAYRDDFAFPVDWLLSWYLASTSFVRPRAVTRCLPHFKSLFKLALPKTFPNSARDWLDAKHDRRLTISYDALYPRLGRVVVAMPESEHLRNVIDPGLGLFRLVDSFAKRLAEQLEPYAHYVGNSAEKGTSDEAQLLLPPVLWQPEVLARFENIAESTRDGTMSAPETFAVLFAPLAPRFVVGYFRNLVAHLESYFGLCMEPDPRYGAALPTLDSHTVFFRLPESERFKEGETLSAGALAAWQSKTGPVWFYAAIVRADRGSQEAKRLAARKLIAHATGWTSYEKLRLFALFEVLVKDMPVSGLKKRALGFTRSSARRMAGELVQICHAAGALTGAANIRALEALFQLLGQDADNLYSMAHAGASAWTGDASAELAAGTFDSMAQSTSQTAQKSGIGLDRQKIARLREETAEASAMLGAIFLQDDQPAAMSRPSETVAESASEAIPQVEDIQAHQTHQPVNLSSNAVVARQGSTTAFLRLPGLNAAHNALLVQLLERHAWQRAEVVALCAPLGLMVDAAVERINEAAFDQFEDALLDGDDTLEINPDIAGELRS
jgi:hypothetical protein